MTRHRTGGSITDPDKIKAARRDRHLSRDELAARLGVASGTIAAYEQGRSDPSASVLIRMAWLFGISADKLCRSPEELDAPRPVRRRRVA
jgi:transcriptional regulator with XRE-family HTH domain